MNPSYTLRNFEVAAPSPMADGEREKVDLAGTRMLIAEECFDAIVQMLIDAGLVSKGCAAVMLDRLSTKLSLHANGGTETQWAIRRPELLDQSTRLAKKAAMIRLSIGS